MSPWFLPGIHLIGKLLSGFNSSSEGSGFRKRNFVYYFAVPASPDTAEISLIKARRKRWQLIIQMLCSVKYVNGGASQSGWERSNVNSFEVKWTALCFRYVHFWNSHAKYYGCSLLFITIQSTYLFINIRSTSRTYTINYLRQYRDILYCRITSRTSKGAIKTALCSCCNIFPDTINHRQQKSLL